ncbi:hypothetical protein B4119_3837 [Parageobacillus caldoxylosilyticus]|uniref:Uncharacterized protein n=1 Tax=Saccharococcus caldoxylosilyticus TaxID=81408 RepID=A0A150M334_9BACL|nr:hypothetical protein B4119_3837 [Parageobacillus caldoxylosilyticus]
MDIKGQYPSISIHGFSAARTNAKRIPLKQEGKSVTCLRSAKIQKMLF